MAKRQIAKKGIAICARLFFSLEPAPPFALELTVWALRDNEVDRWDGETYRRALPIAGQFVEVTVTQTGRPEAPRLEVSIFGARRTQGAESIVIAALNRMLGLQACLTKVCGIAETDVRLACQDTELPSIGTRGNKRARKCTHIPSHQTKKEVPAAKALTRTGWFGAVNCAILCSIFRERIRSLIGRAKPTPGVAALIGTKIALVIGVTYRELINHTGKGTRRAQENGVRSMPIQYASEINADLVVIAMRGVTASSRIVSAVIGSVTEYVMRNSPCPTLVIRLDQERWPKRQPIASGVGEFTP